MSYASKAVLRACQEMAAAEAREEWDEAEIVCCKGVCYLGLRRVHYGTVNGALRLCLFRGEGFGTDCERYTLNEDGRAIAADPAYLPRIVRQNYRPDAAMRVVAGNGGGDGH